MGILQGKRIKSGVPCIFRGSVQIQPAYRQAGYIGQFLLISLIVNSLMGK